MCLTDALKRVRSPQRSGRGQATGNDDVAVSQGPITVAVGSVSSYLPASGRYHPEEGGRPLQGDREISRIRSGEDRVRHRGDRGGIGVIGDSGYHLVGRCIRPPSTPQAGHFVTVALRPATQQIERPQGTRQARGILVPPQFGERVESHPVCQIDQGARI
jgi:hypothetical protein